MGATMHEDRWAVCTLSINVASVDANTTAEQTFTLTGVKPGDYVGVNKPSCDAGLGIVGIRVSAVDTVAITFVNATGTPINPAPETYTFWVMRPEATISGRFNV